MNPWLSLDQIKSRGAKASKPGSLSNLHQHRKVTLSQYFTPQWVVKFAWDCIKHAFKATDSKYSLLDNSVGTASMFRCASPDRFNLHGIDIDGEAINKLNAVFDGTEFETNFVNASMCSVELTNFSVGLINPAFSIQLNSPSLEVFEGITHCGPLGMNTSASSHEYALAQALEHCDVVCAVIPSSVTKKLMNDEYQCIDKKRLRGIFNLPDDTFILENVTCVAVDLLIFSTTIRASRPERFFDAIRVEKAINPQSEAPKLNVQCSPFAQMRRAEIKAIGFNASEPTVKTQASDNKSVFLRKAGRNIKMCFLDGATEAKVKNKIYSALLVADKDKQYPTKAKYSGQFKLSIDVLVLQPDPFQSLDEICRLIVSCGGEPIIDKQLHIGITKMLAHHNKMMTPFSRDAYRRGNKVITAASKLTVMLNTFEVGAVVKKGEVVTAVRNDGHFILKTLRGEFFCDNQKFFNTFEVSENVSNSFYWESVNPPIAEQYPAEIDVIKNKAKALGLDMWSDRDYQLNDLYELAFKKMGICGWQMALGKTRLELALALLLQGPSVIVVKSRLIDELKRELDALNVCQSQVNFISKPRHAMSLLKLNVISYEKLRSAISKKAPGYTYAHLLKSNVTNLFVDEGGCLSNANSKQSISLKRINAKNRFIFDGTPSPNYPREMLGLLCFVSDPSTSYMPYSERNSDVFISEGLFTLGHLASRARNEFTKDFAVFEWATNEFLETGAGAKREVPKIKTENLEKYRKLIAPYLKRRIQQEPEVKKYVDFPVPTLNTPISVSWDVNHLVEYVKTVEEFSRWYAKHMEEQSEDKAGNLAEILMKLEACFQATNVPSQISGYANAFEALTSKERVCVDLVIEEVEKGRRPIVFARNPIVLTRLSKELNKYGVSNIVFTGQESIVKRTKRLNDHIREGDTQVMLASIGVTQDGLNLHQLNTFIFYNRSYKAREEFQAIYRLVRPLQKTDVYGHFLHLEGSIDEYMGQLIEWKTLASEAGLDYGEQPENKDFFHFERFIKGFLESIPALHDKVRLLRKQAA
jgi:hypothetical protein